MLKASVLFLSGLAIVKLFSNDSAWKEVTELACTRELNDNDVRKIVGLMAKCDPISPEEEEAVKHPFVKFWMHLINNRHLNVVQVNGKKLNGNSDFMKQVERLMQNLADQNRLASMGSF